MPFLENRLLIQYISPPNNYIGSTLFLSYIVVALYLTSTIGYSLYTQYTSAFHSHAASTPSKFKQNGAGQVETRNARARHIKIYLSLAFLSFASISWHMLGFLITSILNWNNTSSRNVFVVLGDNGLLKLKSWMLETGLFNDFASQLVGDRESAIWAQLAILATWGWNLWMALKGTLTSSLFPTHPSTKLTPVPRSPIQLHHPPSSPIYRPRPESPHQLLSCPVHYTTAPFLSGRQHLQKVLPAHFSSEPYCLPPLTHHNTQRYPPRTTLPSNPSALLHPRARRATPSFPPAHGHVEAE